MLDYIPKETLVQLMVDWGRGEISTEEMSLWCCRNYRPAAQGDDPTLAPCQQSALYDVLQAFEWQAADDKVTAKRDGWERAVQLLNCSEASYAEAKVVFERDCAGF